MRRRRRRRKQRVPMYVCHLSYRPCCSLFCGLFFILSSLTTFVRDSAGILHPRAKPILKLNYRFKVKEVLISKNILSADSYEHTSLNQSCGLHHSFHHFA